MVAPSAGGAAGGALGFGPKGLGGASAAGTHSSLMSNKPMSPVLSITGRSNAPCKAFSRTDTVIALPSKVMRPLKDPLPDVPRGLGPAPNGLIGCPPPGPGTGPLATGTPAGPAPGVGGAIGAGGV